MSNRRRSARLAAKAGDSDVDGASSLGDSIDSLPSANGSASPKKGTANGSASPSKSKRAYDPAPKSEHFEFMGPPGAAGITLAVIYFSYFFAIGCSDRGCPPWPVDRYLIDGAKQMATLDFWLSLWDTQALVVYLAWYAWTVVCWLVIPGPVAKGAEMRNGERLLYKENGFRTLVVTCAALAGLVVVQGVEPLLFVHAHWTGLVTAMLLMSVAQSIGVYAMSFRQDAMLAEGGNSGNVLYDWFIGRQLNPRIGTFDIKSFNELRPGLILWLLTDLAMAAKQYHDLGTVTDSMLLIVAFQGLYVFDAMYNEPAIFTTMDITTDGFGFMLAAGDLLWVPATYGLQARYLADHPLRLGPFGVAIVLATNFAGYYIFRSANGEKNDFRNGRNPKNLESMETKRGTRLLTSGWWGLSRHPNYLGDWIMAVCVESTHFAAHTARPFDSQLTTQVYFAVLLVHRQRRDDEACHKKYGDDWTRYCKLVPYRIVPYLY